MELPSFDTRPENPLYGPLSMWLLGDNPLDPEPWPESIAELAEGLGVTAAKLHQVRNSKRFRKFHSDHTTSLDEVVQRRQEMLDTLYAQGMAGNVQAATAYLSKTEKAAQFAAAGAQGVDRLPPGDMANLSDAEIEAFMASQPPSQ